MLKSRSSLRPQIFINYVLKYGFQVRRLYLLISFVQGNMNARMVDKVNSIDMKPVTQLLQAIEFHFDLDPSLLNEAKKSGNKFEQNEDNHNIMADGEFLQYVR